ncbi:MAG: hypothetical protein NTU93_03420 [Arthrobacter sp.]|nr:hypothetical protein [Arthrobacter sp.]
MVHDRNRVRKRVAGLVVGAILSIATLAACGEPTVPAAPPLASPPLAAPPATKLPPQPGISTITPPFTELPLDRTTEPAVTLPWHLIRVDLKENRVYLSSSSEGCTTPEKVRLTESASEIKISVTGPRGGEPCTARSLTLVGYVQIGSIGERRVTGNAS